MEAAFFDLDKTVIATSSVMALGGRFYREGLITKRTIVRGIYAQIVYLLLGADDEKMERGLPWTGWLGLGARCRMRGGRVGHGCSLMRVRKAA